MLDIFVTYPIHQRGLEFLKDKCTFKVWEKKNLATEKELIRMAKSAQVLLTSFPNRITEKVLKANPNLKGIANYAVGYDNIDVAAATKLGISVTNTPDVLSEATADLTWALILAVARRIPQGDHFVREDHFKIWNSTLFLGTDVGLGPEGKPKTLGIIGYGRIARAVRRRASGFGMRVIAYSPNASKKKDFDIEFVDFKTVLSQSDFLTLHCALTKETTHLIGSAELKQMKKTAYLINTSRGKVVDEKALVAALKQGVIAGAGLDVYEAEPKLAPGLRNLKNVALLPHIGSATHETRGKMSLMAAENALAMLNGQNAPNIINTQIY